MEETPLTPIQQADSARFKTLDTLFPPEIKISRDLQLLVLDYIYPRALCQREYNGKKWWARMELTMTNDKYHYEIRIYNDEMTEIISTFDITKGNYALRYFDRIFHCLANISPSLSWVTRFENYKTHTRHVFCPSSGKTYRLDLIRSNDKVDHVYVIPLPPRTTLTSFDEIDKRQIAWTQGALISKSFVKYQKLVEEYGGSWDQYPFFRSDTSFDNGPYAHSDYLFYYE